MVVAIARAAVWAIFLPTAYASLLLASMGHAPPLRSTIEMVLAIAALVATRPLLSTDRARAEFAPLALRPWFLASAIGSMASGITLARAAAAFCHFSVLWRDAIGLGALAIPFFIAGVGVLRMRSWGIVMGALTALASIPIVAWIRDPIFAAPVLLTALPAALMGALVAIARLRANMTTWTPSDFEACSPPQTSELRSPPSTATRLRFSSTPPACPITSETLETSSSSGAARART